MDYRIIVGDLAGHPIANLSAIARSRSVSPRLLRPWSFTARVPSDHVEVGALHTDGLPKVESLVRTVRVFRREQQTDGTFLWVVRFAGLVWTVQDEGDENGQAWTTFTAYDPFQRLSRRFTGQDATDRVGDAATLAKQLVDDTNALGSTGISTSAALGAVFQATTSRTVRYDRKAIGEALLDLGSAYHSFDLDFTPIYQAPGTEDGTLVVMSCLASKGSSKPNCVFGWGTGPKNLSKISRQVAPDDVVTNMTGIGGIPDGGTDPLTSTYTTGTDSLYGRYEDVQTETDLVDQAFLDSQTKADAITRQSPVTTYDLTPALGASARVPRAWTDFDLGDTVPIHADARLRGGVNATLRITGFVVNIDDEGNETLGSVEVSAPTGA